MRGEPPAVWPRGTGQWNRLSETRTVIVSADPRKQTTEGETLVVATPLDVIARIEDENSMVATVVLDDPASQRELGRFLLETYPWLQVVERTEL